MKKTDLNISATSEEMMMCTFRQSTGYGRTPNESWDSKVAKADSCFAASLQSSSGGIDTRHTFWDSTYLALLTDNYAMYMDLCYCIVRLFDIDIL